jgi:hypothetical protein
MLDITTLAAWGEFIGGIAVVASLIYLAGQIRQNSKLLRASTASVSNNANTALNTLVVQDEELARIFWEGIADRDSLSEVDRRRFDPVMWIVFMGNSQQYQFERDGIASPEAWEFVERAMRAQFRFPGILQSWRESAEVFPQEFRKLVDRFIREVEAAE